MAVLVLACIFVTLIVQAARFVKRFYVRRFANNINRRMKGILYANLVREEPGFARAGGRRRSDDQSNFRCGRLRGGYAEVYNGGVRYRGGVGRLRGHASGVRLAAGTFESSFYAGFLCLRGVDEKKPVQRAGAAYKKAAGALSTATLDRAQNAVTYRIYGCENTREAQYEGTLETYEKTAVRSSVRQSALPPLYLAVSEAGVLFILWFGAKNVLGTGWRAWDIAAFTTFLSCFTKLTVKSSKVAKLFNSVQKAEVSWKRIRPLMRSPEPLEPLAVPEAADVTLENLSFSYGGAPIFSDLSLTAHPGDIIGVTGPVACGKSTFGRVFLRSALRRLGAVRKARAFKAHTAADCGDGWLSRTRSDLAPAVSLPAAAKHYFHGGRQNDGWHARGAAGLRPGVPPAL